MPTGRRPPCSTTPTACSRKNPSPTAPPIPTPTDLLGNFDSATGSSGTITFTYGNVSNPNLLTEVLYADGTYLRFSYNIVAQRTQSVDQTGYTVNYTYDAVGRLSQLTDGSGNLIVKYTQPTPQGNLVQKLNGNGTYTVHTYDHDGNVLTITNYAPGGTVNSVWTTTRTMLKTTYMTDTNQDGQWVYSYDADSVLTGRGFHAECCNRTGCPRQDLQYSYDAVGNRLSETVNGVTTTYVANNMNEAHFVDDRRIGNDPIPIRQRRQHDRRNHPRRHDQLYVQSAQPVDRD